MSNRMGKIWGWLRNFWSSNRRNGSFSTEILMSPIVNLFGSSGGDLFFKDYFRICVNLLAGESLGLKIRF